MSTDGGGNVRRIIVVGLSLAAALLFSGRLQAHEGHKVMGTVTAVDASHVELKDQAGKTVSIALTSETKYRKHAAAGTASADAAAADLKVGQRVAVSVSHEGEKMTATEVVLGTAQNPPAKEKPHEH
jgi:hypothetical protein